MTIKRIRVILHSSVIIYEVGENNVDDIIDRSDEDATSLWVCTNTDGDVIHLIENCSVIVDYAH